MMLQYCEMGAHVVGVARTESKLKSVVKECKTRGGIGYYVKADFATEDESIFN